MSERKYIEEWVDKANKDLKTVDIIKDYEDMNEIICFHCQQAAEKYLKALLIYNNVEVTKTHNIDYLLKQNVKYDEEFISYIGSPLADYAVDIRYPDIRYIPNETETKLAIKLTSEIIEIVKKNMKF